MTDLAFAGKCGGLGASGFSRTALKPSRSSRYCSASAPNPCAARVSTSRRVITGRMCGSLSRDIDELISIHKSQAKIRQRSAILQELLAQLHLDRPGCSRQRQLVSPPQLETAVTTAFALQPRRKTVGFFSHEVTVEQRERL